MEEDFKISGDVASIDLPTGSGKGYNAYFALYVVYMFFVDIIFLKEE